MIQKTAIVAFAVIAGFAVYLLFPDSPTVEAPVAYNAEKTEIAELVELNTLVTDPKSAVPEVSPPQDTPDDSANTHIAPATWSFNGITWTHDSSACSDPIVLQTPVDMNLVVMALWPGQVRNEYKAHGGFRFDNNGPNTIAVRAPIGSHLAQASRYIESGEEQYLLFFTVPCGFFYRFDHVSVLSPKLQEALKDLPPATADSRTTFIEPLWVDAGEVIGTSVGVSNNIFIDFGLYDVRKPNNVTPRPEWAELYAADKAFSHYGICFFDYLPASDGAAMRALPTGKEGKTSDYCK